MAGCVPITREHQRARTVRPKSDITKSFINPLHDNLGDAGAEEIAKDEVEHDEWEDVAKKVEELETKLAEQFEQENENETRATPIKAPAKPTREQWERHQVTHIPYAPWCPHCLVARNVRRQHPSHGRGSKIVPDIESGEGPTKVSLDYMYSHERAGKYRDMCHNPQTWRTAVLDKHDH